MNNIISASSVTTNKLFLIFVMMRFNREKPVSQHSCKSISLPRTSEQRRIANARKPTEDGEQRLLLLRPPVIFAAAAVSLRGVRSCIFGRRAAVCGYVVPEHTLREPCAITMLSFSRFQVVKAQSKSDYARPKKRLKMKALLRPNSVIK